MDHDQKKSLKVKNVYLENPEGTECDPDAPTANCWRNLIITDGTYTRGNDGILYPDDNTTYIIEFVELQLQGDFSTPNKFEHPHEEVEGTDKNKGLKGVNFYVELVVKDEEYKSSTDLSKTTKNVIFELISENNFTFYVEMNDGRKFEGNYEGTINILEREVDFVPGIYWKEG